MKRLTATLIIALAAAATAMAASVTVHPADSAVTDKPLWAGISSPAGAIVLDAGITQLLKGAVHEWRPDGSGNDAFPSRHTSWAYGIGTSAAIQLYSRSPWWALGAQTIAGAVGVQRIAAGRHWGGDVAAGAAIGIASAWTAEALTRLFSHAPSPWRHCPASDFMPALSAVSTAAWWLGTADGFDPGTAFGTAVHFRLPLSGHWGVSARAEVLSMPVRSGVAVRPLTSAAITLGASAHYGIGGSPGAFVAAIEYGPAVNAGAHVVRRSGISFVTRAEGGAEWRLTRAFAVRATAGLRSLGRSALAADVSMASVATF